MSAPTLPITERSIAETAEILNTDGSVTLVSETAPVTSEYVVTGAPPKKAAKQQEMPSPNKVLC